MNLMLPTNQLGARRVGWRWQDCPSDYGLSTTVYNRFTRWSHLGLWARQFATLSARTELPDDLSTAVRLSFRSRRKRGGARVAVQPPKSMR